MDNADYESHVEKIGKKAPVTDIVDITEPPQARPSIKKNDENEDFERRLIE